MAIAKNSRQENEIVASEFLQKAKLEEALARELRHLFKHIRFDFELTYARERRIVDVKRRYADDFTALLKKYYRKTAEKFSKTIQDSLFQKKEDPFISQTNLNNMNRGILLSTIDYISKHTATQVNYILETTEKQLTQNIQSVIADAAKEGKYLSVEEIAQKAGDLFQRETQARSYTIALTEIQNIAETSKEEEAKGINEGITTGAITGVSLIKKKWNALLDKRTRIAHALADGQLRDIAVPFNVDNEFLQYPGDTSLGATAGNVINCRCAVVHIIS